MRVGENPGNEVVDFKGLSLVYLHSYLFSGRAKVDKIIIFTVSFIQLPQREDWVLAQASGKN